MIFLALSAAFVGLVHSLAPGHWLPVVLMAKGRRWSTRMAVTGALVTASGHIFLSLILAIAAIAVGAHFLNEYEHEIESYSGLILILFGLVYAIQAYFRHSSCHGHTHHGPNPPNPEGTKGPFLFLFSVGLSPCVAVLPVFVAAAPEGVMWMTATMIAFAAGVIGALVGATLLVSYGVMKLDHPIFEHYGDVITGIGVAILGLVLFLLPHSHG